MFDLQQPTVAADREIDIESPVGIIFRTPQPVCDWSVPVFEQEFERGAVAESAGAHSSPSQDGVIFSNFGCALKLYHYDNGILVEYILSGKYSNGRSRSLYDAYPFNV